MTWWNYKHHNTVKLLICETPQGVVSFVTKACGERITDKYIAGLTIRRHCRQEL